VKLSGLILFASAAIAVAQPMEFAASNTAGKWAVEASLGGRYVREVTSIDFDVRTLTLSRPERFIAAKDVVSICALVIRVAPDGSWKTRLRSAPHALALHLNGGQTVAVDPFQLTIPLGDAPITRMDRLAFELQTVVVQNGKRAPGYIYIRMNSDRPEPIPGAAPTVGHARDPKAWEPDGKYAPLCAPPNAGRIESFVPRSKECAPGAPLSPIPPVK
jgi:hypothetical protein